MFTTIPLIITHHKRLGMHVLAQIAKFVEPGNLLDARWTAWPSFALADAGDTGEVRWSIDAADAYSVAKVRRQVVEQLRQLSGEDADLYAVETVLGELLGAEMERGHFAVAIIIERAVGGPAVHIYTQGTPAVNSTQGELRDAILHGTHLPMSIEATSQGTHISLRVPSSRKEAFEHSR